MEAQRADQSKRRFLKAGLVAAPVIVTLSAKPTWAQTQATTGYVPANANCSVTQDANCVPLDSTLSSDSVF